MFRWKIDLNVKIISIISKVFLTLTFRLNRICHFQKDLKDDCFDKEDKNEQLFFKSLWKSEFLENPGKKNPREFNDKQCYSRKMKKILRTCFLLIFQSSWLNMTFKFYAIKYICEFYFNSHKHNDIDTVHFFPNDINW